MPCYNPLIRIEDTTKWKKAGDGHKYHPATIQQASKILGERLEDINNISFLSRYGYQTIPCGNCIGCRLEYSRQWANRGYLESKCWDQNWFVTLTYNEENVMTTDGEIQTLEPEKITAFMKALRQEMALNHGQKAGIRFMAAGEYGEEGRPHYHLILFNCNLPIESFYNPRIKRSHLYWQNHIIEKCWSYGISNISECSWNNIAYTARYITKKINGKLEEEAYAEGQQKEFFRVSRMPGIGEPYYRQHKYEIYKRDEIIIKNMEGVISTKPPEFFDKLYEAENPEDFKKIKEKRKRLMKQNNRIKEQNTSLDQLDQLQIERRTKEEKTLKLIREFEKKQKK